MLTNIKNLLFDQIRHEKAANGNNERFEGIKKQNT
jgi:hypothetical protein